MFRTQRRPDGRIEVPRTVEAAGLIGDAVDTLSPGDPGYDEAAAQLDRRRDASAHPDVTFTVERGEPLY